MDQRRLWLAVGISIVVLLLYQELVLRQYQQVTPGAPPDVLEETRQPPATAVVPTRDPAPREVAAPLAAPVDSADGVTVETEDVIARFALSGGRLASLRLKHFRSDVAPESPTLDLVTQGDVLPMTIDLGASRSDAGLEYSASASSLRLSGSEHGAIELTAVTSDGTRLEKRYRFSGRGYLFEAEVRVTGPGAPNAVGIVLTPVSAAGAMGGSAPGGQLLALAKDKLVSEATTTIADEARTIESATWAGFAGQYFILAAVPAAGPQRAGFATIGAQPVARLDTTLEKGVATFEVFAGPKERTALVAAGHGLDRALDFGWFWFIALPLLEALKLIHRVVGNYGVAIIVLTTIVKLGTVPLTQHSLRSMKEMRRLEPQMKRIRERHKDDQAAMQREIMELYRRNKVNPLSGCLPMVLQIPIFVGLYNALMHAIELRHAPFLLWINDLSAPDRLMVFGFGIPVLTLLMGASMLVQQWLTPQQGDPTQQRMMMIMPVIFTFMFVNFPAGLVLYWLVNNVLSIGQQYLVLRS